MECTAQPNTCALNSGARSDTRYADLQNEKNLKVLLLKNMPLSISILYLQMIFTSKFSIVYKYSFNKNNLLHKNNTLGLTNY